MKTYHKSFSFIIFVTIIFTFNGYCLAALKCAQCETSDKDCTINPDKIQATDCKDDDKVCFMKLGDKGQVERGCGAENYCEKEANKEECVECNEAESCKKIFPEKRPKCFVCSGKDCLKVDEKNVQTCQFYKKDQTEHCLTNTENNENVIRNCTEGYEGKCEGDNCKTCLNEDNKSPCNKDEVKPKVLKCAQCTSSDKDCTINPDKIEAKDCKDADKVCFMKLGDKGQVERGCGAEHYCEKEANKEECVECNEAESCKKIFPEKRPKCFVCSGKDCLKVDEKNVQTCQFYKKDQTEHCLTNTENNENVIRNCTEGYEGKCEGDNCKTCLNEDNKSPCNKDEVKPKVLKCAQCTSSDKDCTINPDKIEAKDCKDADKVCFMKLGDKGQVERGCGAEDFCGTITNKEECDVCKDAESCKIIFPAKRPKCYVCSGKDCLKVESKNVQTCQFYKKDQKEHCFTNTENNDNVIRDCTEGYEGKCEGDNCKKCLNEDGKDPCNKDEVSSEFECYTCRSDADPECEYAERDKAKTAVCENKSKGCYSERFDGKTFRACADILDQKETEVCNANKNICKICDKHKCNGAKINSGTIKSISVILMISSILLTGKFFN